MSPNLRPLPRFREALLVSPAFWTILFLVGAAMLAFVRLDVPLQEPQESRYAEIPRQMLAEDNWLVPVLHGEPYLDKPPLLYWLVMASYSVFGVHDWAARLIPCTATFLTMAVTYFWGRLAFGARGRFLAGMILCLSLRYVYLSRMLTMDSLLCLFVVAALAGAYRAMCGPAFCWRPLLLSALACGLGLLTKGPVALVLAIPPIVVYPLVARDASRPRLGAWLAYGGVVTIVALPWYLAVVAADPAFLDYFFWKHNVERFLTPFDHQEPFWFYVPEILLGMLPWTLLVPGTIRLLLRERFGISSSAGFQSPVSNKLTFFLVAFVWCVLFFSLAGCKRPGYVLPAMPLLALALGGYLDSRLPGFGGIRALWRHGSRLACAGMFLTLLSGVGSCLVAVHVRLVAPYLGVALAILGVAALIGLAWHGWRRGLKTSWLACGAAAFLALIIGMYAILPGYTRKFSMRAQVRPHAATCTDPAILVACYPRRWDSVSFYLGRNDVRVYTTAEKSGLVADLAAAPRTMLFIKSNQAVEKLRRELPASLELVMRGPQGVILVGMVRPRERNTATTFAAH